VTPPRLAPPPGFPDDVPLEIRRSARARRLRLEVRPGRLRLTVPKACPPAEAERFLAERAAWVREKTRAWRELAPPGEGPVDPPIPAPWNTRSGGSAADAPTTHVVFRGRRTPLRTRLVPEARPGVSWDATRGIVVRLPDRWPVEVREPRGRRALSRWYDALLGEEAARVVEVLGRPRGLVPHAVRFSQPRTRWGSCAADGIVRLNRRLVGAPAPVFRYVVIHEIAHLRHRDHSRRFWELVEEMEPAWRDPRRWLKEHGVALG
jgi:predicted metal-dependent hydrolase